MSNAGAACPSCGRPLPTGAAFCRNCGASVTRAEPAPVAPAAPPPKRRGRAALIAVAAVLLVAAGAAAAILLTGGDGDSGQPAASPATDAATVPASSAAPSQRGEASPAESTAATTTAAAAGSISPGRYVQAGSFRTVAGAETERERLEAAGIDVDVVASDQAEELYPGFQVLLGGPFPGPSAAQPLLAQLHRNGVPSAFLRPLSPAAAIAGPEAIAGRWAGTLERTGSSRSSDDGPLSATLTAIGDGRQATLKFAKPNCEVGLSLQEEGSVSLTYAQEGECVGAGTWEVRPQGEELQVVLLPPNTEVIVIGTLSR